ncbi:MAG: isoprenylcysteine carboxylmethyltransferase family protein [Anaerolineales bacterium]
MTAQALNQTDRRKILIRGFTVAMLLTAMMSVTLFASAGTLAWMQAWIFIGLFVVYFALWVWWGLRYSPELIMERGQALQKRDSKQWDQILVRVNLLLSIITYVVAGLDAARYGWTLIPAPYQVVGLAFILFGYIFPFWALSNNPFASGTVRIQTERGHTVSTGGPYRFVRHPMYVGAIVADIGIPLFLGSYWALIPGALMAALFIYRTWREDVTLQEELPGYKEYAQKVRYRLLPGVW